MALCNLPPRRFFLQLSGIGVSLWLNEDTQHVRHVSRLTAEISVFKERILSGAFMRVGQGSVIGIATRYRLNGPGIESW